MATKKVKIKVGVFLLACFSLMIVSVAYVSGLYKEDGVQYWLEFEESVLGVYEGGIVEYLGLPIGKVSDMSVTPTNRAYIEITIDPDKVVLQRGVEAQLVLYSLAAGTMAVELSGGKLEDGPLPPNSQIPTRPSAFSAISTKIEGLMSDASSIMDKIEKGFHGLEDGELTEIVARVGRILDQVETLVVDTQDTMKAGKTTLASIEERIDPVTEEVLALSKNIRQTSESADEFLRVATEKTSQLDIASLGGKADQVLEQITELTTKLNASVATLDESSATMLHEADNLEYSFRATLLNTSDTLLALESLLSQIKEDPASLLRGKSKLKE